RVRVIFGIDDVEAERVAFDHRDGARRKSVDLLPIEHAALGERWFEKRIHALLFFHEQRNRRYGDGARTRSVGRARNWWSRARTRRGHDKSRKNWKSFHYRYGLLVKPTRVANAWRKT